MSRIQDHAAVMVGPLLDILGMKNVTAAKRQELENYLRDEIADIERQIAADRSTPD
jgi:hypothetical protein